MSPPKADPPNANSWNAALYDDRHAFVYEQAAELIDLLRPQAGERILDIGCGTGHLTAQIAQACARALGIDASAEMIDRARANYPQLEFHVADVRQYQATDPFDAVFSNAALHWVKPAEAAVRRISAALKPGGRLVAELGGRGNVQQIVSALGQAIAAVTGRGVGGVNPWYFPSVAEYAALLEREGLEVRYAILFDRPTPLDAGEAGMANWLAMFGQPCLTAVSDADRPAVIADAIERMRPRLYHDGSWTADYRRLRLMAVKNAE